MSSDSVANARRFVEALRLRPTPRAGDAPPQSAVDLALDAAKDQAAVVGSDVISFVSGVTAERRAAIIDSSLLAQLVAKKTVGDPSRIDDWYDAYFEVLTNIGWLVQDRSFAEYREQHSYLDAHQAILAVATALLGTAPAALALVKATLDALRSMDADSPWITIFSRECQAARTARFQISLAEQDPNGQFFVTLMAFGLEATSTVTQVLFFRASASEATLRHFSGRVTISTDVLDGVRDAIRAKLAGVAADYVRLLP